MNSTTDLPLLARVLQAVALLTVAATSTPAATIWTGSLTNYSQPGTDPTQPANQDRLTPNVWLTRGGNQGLFNARTEIAFTHFLSPADTEWANGTTANYASLSYTDWNTWAKITNGGPPSTVGVNAVVHLISEDIYLDIKFTSWPVGGGFAYQRSTPAPPSPIPSVSITNPVNNATFTNPVAITVQAVASVGVGSVTNVEFFSNGSPLGDDQTAPYSVSSGSLAAGSYAYTAVATAAGLSTTSSVVNITVVNPTPSVSITNPVNAATFTAPATFQIDATAAVASGSVTNVAFFASGNPLGSDQTAPFSISTGSLSAGAYALTAIATAGGVASTSAVVNVSVLAPGAIILSSPKVAAGQFSFDYTASIGVNYVVQNSSNLSNWLPLSTNTAASNLVHYVDGVVPGGARYYRVGQIIP